MNKYKKVLFSLRLLLLIIILGTLFFIFYPIYLNMSKSKMDIGVSFLMKDSENYQWFMNQEKIQENLTKEELLVFADEEILDPKVLETIYHKSVVLERVFYTLNEDIYKTQQLTQLSGIEYSGYSGKTYQDLSSRDEVPSKIIEQYETQFGKKWTFYGEGIVISSIDNIIVLKKGEDYKGTMMLSNDSTELSFLGNFEITSCTVGTEAEANFSLNLTNKGEDIFKKYNIQSTFPAYYIMNSPLYDLYYFTGDYSAYVPDLPAIHEYAPTIMKNKIFYSQRNNEQVYWKWYYPELKNIIQGVQNEEFDYASEVTSNQLFYTKDKKIYKRNSNGESKEFFIKGVNLGAALPGKEFTEFPQDKSIYLEWFAQMETLNINTVRIYTLFPPVFYEALYEYNKSSEQPIYLFQEIWPEGKPLNENYLATEYNVTYQEEIKNVVEAIHGDGNIPERKYRAYGLYRFDVSEYLLGYLVGREMEPEEVLATDSLNSGYMYEGEYIYSDVNASPTEGWLAASCDYVLQIEDEYKSKPMVGIVSWPTLDSLTHDSEWNETGDKSLQYNDKAVIDIDHIMVDGNKVSGFFGAYHIYPNYPDFMNNDAEYANYSDEEGEFRYGGYLQDFMQQNVKYPAIVAEYGISTSMYTAHYNPNGYHHGGLNEDVQADGIIRMTKAIITEEYAGAIIFEWMDEWAKKTWTTEPYMIPYNQNVYWHNAMDPEQNYGLIAYKTNPSILNELTDVYQNDNNSGVKKVSAGQDKSYIYVDLEFAKKLDTADTFTMTISTSSEIIGNDFSEFIIQYSNTPKILVNPGYNWLTGHFTAGNYDYYQFEELIQNTNKESIAKDGTVTPSQSQNLSQLSIGSFDIPQNQIQIVDNHVIIRIPYGLIGISDPSTLCILSDAKVEIPTAQDSVNTKKEDTIKYNVVYGEKNYSFQQTLLPWENVEATAIEKKSFEEIAVFFGKIE